MKNLSFQSLNALFDCFEAQANAVLWIRDKDYRRQLYLGSSFEKIWGRERDILYQAPDVFKEFLLEADKRYHDAKTHHNCSQPEQASSVVSYRIVDSTNQIKFLRDHHFMLVNDEGEHTGFVGLCQIISEREWAAIQQASPRETHNTAQIETLKKDLFVRLHKELAVSVSPGTATACASTVKKEPKSSRVALLNDGNALNLTPREAECLYYLAAGKTAKQTAQYLKVSPRTVVFHLDNVRQKAGCSNKIELLGKLRLG